MPDELHMVSGESSDCEAVKYGDLWIYACGFMVQDRMLANISGETEDELTRIHHSHHEHSIAKRLPSGVIRANLRKLTGG